MKARAVYTDGACSGNPGPGGWAWAIDRTHYASGFASHTTNQRMEIQAALEAVTVLDGPLEIVSDSTYVVNCFRQRWWQGWLDRGWVNSQKQPVANRDLWEPFIELVRRRGNVSFRWVKGHSGDTMNDFVDELAVESIRRRKGRALGVAIKHPKVVAERAPLFEKRLRKPTVYLVSGGTGAGKTTYAIALAKDQRALRFSIDEWMQELFLPDSRELAFEWMLERVRRCENQIWSLCRQALSNGASVVLDLGFSFREQRERFRVLAEQENATVEVHFLDVAPEVRRERIRERNENRNRDVFALEVTQEMFDFMEARFEPPSDGEFGSGIRLVKTKSA